MPGDAVLLLRITAIKKARPTYGCRRVWALLNKHAKLCDLPPVNHKRVRRLMRKYGLLCNVKYASGQRRKKGICGSEKLWCGDGFELECLNGEVVRVIFVLDCFNREALSVALSRKGFSARLAKKALTLAIAKRFGSGASAGGIQWLTDNASCFRSKALLDFCVTRNVHKCFAPPAKPWRNGMAEAFVKSLKRDYANLNPLPCFRKAQGIIEEWLRDYNENAPHKSLGWLSPAQFTCRNLESRKDYLAPIRLNCLPASATDWPMLEDLDVDML